VADRASEGIGPSETAVAVERRLEERPHDIREAARALSGAIADQIDQLNASKRNDPDALSQQEDFIAFLRRIAAGLDELAESLDRAVAQAPVSRAPLYAKSAEIARRLGNAVTEGLEENRASIMACGLRVSVVAAGTLLLHLLGVGTDLTAIVSAGLMGISIPRDSAK
jgi:hypothetical protein